MLTLTLIDILMLLINVVTFLVFVQFIVSILVSFNVVNSYNQFVRSVVVSLDRLLNPLYSPFRRLLPDTGAIDFAPLALLVVLQILRIVLSHVAASVAFGQPM